MSRYMTVGLSMLAGALLGAAAVESLHAQQKPRAYVISEATIIRNQELYAKEFMPTSAKAVEAAGGKYIARGGNALSFQGPSAVGRVALVQFKSLDKAQEWWNSQATKEAYAAGKKYATFRTYALESVSP